jgi:hypothetical protein
MLFLRDSTRIPFNNAAPNGNGSHCKFYFSVDSIAIYQDSRKGIERCALLGSRQADDKAVLAGAGARNGVDVFHAESHVSAKIGPNL